MQPSPLNASRPILADTAGSAVCLSHCPHLTRMECRAYVIFEDDHVGHIRDLYIDPQTGSILFAILAVQPLEDQAVRHMAVPWSTLRYDAAAEEFRIDIDALILPQPRDSDSIPAPSRSSNENIDHHQGD